MRRQVNCVLVRMYDAYERGRGAQNNMFTKLSERLSRSSSSGPMGVRPSLRMAQFVREIEDSLEKTEVKVNFYTFLVLSLVARHVFTIDPRINCSL